MSFEPMVKRVLHLVDPEGNRDEFSIAIGKPYRPAKTEGMEDHAACEVEICGNVDTEVFGFDELEALENALDHVNLMLTGIASSANVYWADGHPFSMESRSGYTKASSAISEVAKRKFGRNGGRGFSS